MTSFPEEPLFSYYPNQQEWQDRTALSLSGDFEEGGRYKKGPGFYKPDPPSFIIECVSESRFFFYQTFPCGA